MALTSILRIPLGCSLIIMLIVIMETSAVSGQPVTSKRFKHQMVHGNFKGLAVSKTVSLTQCSAYCLTVTEDHHCTTFKREDSDKVCHCGILSPFVIEHENQEQMYVRSNCKASNISAFFGVLEAMSGSLENGLFTRAIGIDGITECATTTNMPSSNMVTTNVVYVGGAIYSFGGLAEGSNNPGTDTAYRYDLATDQWTQISSLIHPRWKASVIPLGINEILITGGVLYAGSNQGSTEIFNVDTGIITIGPDFPYPTHGHCGVTHKVAGQAYFVGGRGDWGDDWTNIPGIRAFDMVQRTFSIVTSQMSVGRANHACVIMEEEGLLIAAGGNINPELTTDSVEILDLKTKTWTNVHTLPSNSGTVWATGEVVFYWDTELYQYEAVSDNWLKIEDVPFELDQVTPQFVQVDAGVGSFCPYA